MVIQADHTHAVDLLAAEHEWKGEKKHTLSPQMYLTCTCKHMASSSGLVLDLELWQVLFFFLAHACSSHYIPCAGLCGKRGLAN